MEHNFGTEDRTRKIESILENLFNKTKFSFIFFWSGSILVGTELTVVKEETIW